ncbi:MAG: chemotaxis protein CheW [Acidobacteriota bacterium]
MRAESSPSAVRLCIARVSGVMIGVDATASRGVIEVERLTRVPGAPPHVLGLCMARDALVPLVDPASHLGLLHASTVAASAAPQLGLRLCASADDGLLEAALRVDAVIDLATANPGDRLPADDGGAPAALVAYTRHRCRHARGTVHVLDAERLLHDLRPAADAAR